MKKDKKISKFTDSYFKRKLLTSSALIMLLSLVLFVIFALQSVSERFRSEQNRLASENSECYTTINETFENAKRITMFFASYKNMSPIYQDEVNYDIRKAMLLEEAKTFLVCFDYISNIYVDTSDAEIEYGSDTTDELESLGKLKSFNLYITMPEAFPPLLVLEHVSQNLNTYTTRLTISAKYISEHYMTNQTYLLSKDGQILLAKDSSCIGKQFDALENEKNSNKYLYTMQPFYEEGMMLVTLTPKTTIYHDLMVQVFLLLFGSFFLCACGIMILYIALRHLYKPMQDVANVLKYYMPNNDSMLESDALFIKECLKRYHTSSDLDAAMIQIRKSQIVTLHSQISPHMLGNSLETIKWRMVAKYEGDTEIETALASLSHFLKNAYQYQQIIVPIREEIEEAKYYEKTMMSFAFKQLKVNWIVSDDALDYAIIAMSIQPFLENCITHGFTKKETAPMITVRISSDFDCLYIEIEDNGCGMTKDTLTSIRGSLANDDIYRHRHIGIKNVHLKLKLLFGEDYGVTDIHSNENGTYVKLTLPKIMMPNTIL